MLGIIIHLFVWFQNTRDQHQEELGLLRSRLQSQINNQLLNVSAPARRMAIVPPLPRPTSSSFPPPSPSLPDCMPGTPGSVGECGGGGGASSHPPPPSSTPSSSLPPTPTINTSCSPYPVSSTCSPSPHAHTGTPSSALCSPRPPRSTCSTPAGGPGSVGSSTGGPAVQERAFPKVCASPNLEKAGRDGGGGGAGGASGERTQGSTSMLHDLLEFDWPSKTLES